jgi:transcription elongation factor Elf1
MTIFRSLLITILVAAAFGFGLRNIFGFWETTVLAFVCQFLIAFTISSLKINRVDNLTAEFEAEIDQLLSLSETSVVCPCNNHTFRENIFINMDNSYTCKKCNNTYRVDVNLMPTLLTEPIDVNKTFTDLKEEADNVKDIKITSDYKPGTEL